MARIYVASLSDYNAGKLHGLWIDLGIHDTAEKVQTQVDLMLEQSSEAIAEETAIHDYEGFGDIKINEYDSFNTVCTLAELFSKYPTAVVAFAYDRLNDLDNLEDYINENYNGFHKSLEDFAEELCEDTGDLKNVPEFLKYYIDWQSFAEDLFINDYDYQEDDNGGFHVFRRC